MEIAFVKILLEQINSVDKRDLMSTPSMQKMKTI